MHIFEAEWPDCWKPFSAAEWRAQHHADTCLSLDTDMLHSPDSFHANLELNHIRLLPASSVLPEVSSSEPSIHTIIRSVSWNDAPAGWKTSYHLVIQSYYATRRIVAEVDDKFIEDFIARIGIVHNDVLRLLKMNDLDLIDALKMRKPGPWRMSTTRKQGEDAATWLGRVRSDALDFALKTTPDNLFGTRISQIQPDYVPSR